MTQSHTSRDTSMNQVATVFRKMLPHFYGVNIDIGGGKYDAVQQFFIDIGCLYVTNIVYDPYNRDKKYNKESKKFFGRPSVSTVTIANVLNVIKEKQERIKVLKLARGAMSARTLLMVQIYPGDRSGVGRETKPDCWQENRPLDTYLAEVQQVFPGAKIYKNLIIWHETYRR